MKKKIMISIFLLAIILIILSVVGYNLDFNRSINYKNLLNKSLDNFYNYVSDNIKNRKDNITGEIKLTTNTIDLVTSKYSGNEFFNSLSGNNVNLNFSLNSKNKTLYTDIVTHYNNEEKINIKVNYQDKNKYLYIENNYDKYLKEPIDGIKYENIFSILTFDEKYLKILEGLVDFTKTINSSLFIGDINLNINNTDKKVKVANIVIDDNIKEYFELNKADLIINKTDFKKAYSEIFTNNFDDITDLVLKGDTQLEYYFDSNKLIGIKISNYKDEKLNSIKIIFYDKNKIEIEGTVNNFNFNGDITIDGNITMFNIDIPVYDLSTLNVNLSIEIFNNNEIEKMIISDYYTSTDVFIDKEFEVYDNMGKRRDIVSYRYFKKLMSEYPLSVFK